MVLRLKLTSLPPVSLRKGYQDLDPIRNILKLG
jgi:hypothetical protein